MINYEGSVNVHDAINYWAGAWCWRVTTNPLKVTAYQLHIDNPEDGGRYLFDEWACMATQMVDADERPEFRTPTGYDLFSTAEWKIQRFPIEYVPIGTSHVVRLGLSPSASRMFKGYNGSYLRTLPLLDSAVPDGLLNRYVRRPRIRPEVTISATLAEFVRHLQEGEDEFENEYDRDREEEEGRDWNHDYDWVDLYRRRNEGSVYQALIAGERRGLTNLNLTHVCKGIASVLEIGLPPVMRNIIGIDRAQENARRAVKQFMHDTSRKVLVPSFDMAVIKHRSRANKAIVLRNGSVFGHLVLDEELAHPRFMPYNRATATDKELRKLLRESTKRVAQSVLTPNVGD